MAEVSTETKSPGLPTPVDGIVAAGDSAGEHTGSAPPSEESVDSEEDVSEEVKSEAIEPDSVESPEDAKHAMAIKEIAKNAPKVLQWHHPRSFTNDEDIIIAAGLASLTPIYKIAQTIHCDRRTLSNHIEKTPALAQLQADQSGMRREQIQEGIDELVRLRHPNVLMWGAEKLLSDIYGKDRAAEEEDDSILVIGEIPESGIAEGDAILAAAEEAPPDVGLTAFLDERVSGADAKKEDASEQRPPQLPQPAQQQPKPQEDNSQNAVVKQSSQTSRPTVPPSVSPVQPSWQQRESSASVPPVALADDLVDDGQFSDGFDGPGGWI